MSIREQILQITVTDPQYQQSIPVIKQQLATTNLVSEDLIEAIKMLEYVFQNPEAYSEVRQAAIQDGLIDEGMFPPQYDKVLIITLLAVLYAMQEDLNQKGYARGGLKVGGRQLDFGGQGGDTMLAHINPREAEVLRRMGGQGTVNPNTGLREYKGLKDAIKIALPIALTFVAGPLGSAIGTALTAGTAFAAAGSIIGGAIVGAGSSALTSLINGDGLNFKNLAIGALSGGIGGAAGPLGEIIGGATNLSTPVASMAAGALTGVGQAAVRGDNLGSGAVKGIISQAINKPITNSVIKPSESVINNIKSGIGGFFDASNTGGFSGISDGVFSEQGLPVSDNFTGIKAFDFTAQGPFKLTDKAIIDPIDASLAPGMRVYQRANNQIMTDQQALQSDLESSQPFVNSTPLSTISQNAPSVDQIISEEGQFGGETPPVSILNRLSNSLPDINMKTIGMGLLATSLLDNNSPEVQTAISGLSEDQKEYFNRKMPNWDWGKINQAANAAGTSVTEFITNPKFESEADSGIFDSAEANNPMMRARGGLSAIPGYATGSGDGRDDLINARLSDGEYVIDAESVSMLGNGSNKAGASMLNQMRKNLRSHKGKALADGRFSPDAKSPLEYMKRIA
jgi:hypothetical protein